MDAIPLRRAYKGFRRLVETELGEEQLCATCRQLWPVDDEFYRLSAGSLSYECRACAAERHAARAARVK